MPIRSTAPLALTSTPAAGYDGVRVLGSTAARTVLVAAWLFPLAYAASLGCTRDHPEPQTFEVRAEPTKPPDPYEHSASRFGTVPLHAGFSPDPRVVAGTAAGEVPADSVHRKCRGWIAKTPDYLLDADTAFFQLHVLGRSKEDVVLIVRKPDGSVLCNDNRPGTQDPMIRSDFPIGTTQVWVGVKEKGSRAPYRLGFSEVKWKSSSISLPDKN